MNKIINDTVSKFKTEDEIKKTFNTTHLEKVGNIVQVQHFQTKLYHYLVECTQGWNELMASKNPIYGKGE
jgi:hypothetical protein